MLSFFGKGRFPVCAALLFLSGSVLPLSAQVGYEAAPGAAVSARVHEIRGLPPQTPPGEAEEVWVPILPGPRQADPFLAPNPTNLQEDLGGILDSHVPLYKSFQGITNTGWYPADPVVAAGPSYLVACTNSHVAFFDKKTGQRLSQTSATSFFSPVGTSGIKIFDPWVIYDEHVDRFMILFVGTTSSLAYNYLAISKTASPLNGWWLYRNDMRLNGSTPTSNWGDYPRLATDRNAIYITANMFKFGGGFQYAKIRILQNKSQLVNGTTTQLWWDFWNISISGSSTKAFTIQPCHDYDSKPTNGAAYFVSSINGSGSNIYFYAITNVTNRTSGPSLFKTRVAVGSYASPGNAVQKGTSTRYENVAPRLMNAVKRNGAVWTAHSIKRDANSSYLRWYEFRVNNWPSSGSVTKRQEGSFFAANLWYTFPVVSVNRKGDMAVVFNRSGQTEYISVRWAGRRVSDPLNQLQHSSLLKAGEASYVRLIKGRNRWGDYSGICADPDGTSIWIMGEYPRSSPANTWATWIGRVFAPAPTYWVSSFGQAAGKALLGFDSSGRLITTITLSGAVNPAAVCMAGDNYRVLVFDSNKAYRYYLGDQTILRGSVFSSALTTGGGQITWGITDEGGGIAWATSNGRIYRAADIFGTSTTLVYSNSALSFNALAWNGETGDYVAATWGTTSGRVYFIGRDGTVKKVVNMASQLSGVDFNPFDGKLYLSRFGGTGGRSLVRLTQSGSWTLFGPTGSPVLNVANSVEVSEQPVARLYGVEAGSSPQHLWRATVTGTTAAIHVSSGVFLPSDLEITRQRALWTASRFRVGQTGLLSLNFGPEYAGDRYQVATSIGYRPGYPLGPGFQHLLTGDILIVASVLGLDGGTIWQRFAGILDRNGRALPGPRVKIPAVPALRGLRFYYGAVAYNTIQGIRAVSNLCGVTIE